MYNLAGECLRSLEVGTRLHTFGERIADRRLQVLALDVIGWSHTMQGEWDAGIEALQHAIAVSPDAFETAFTLGLLGYAYLDQGDIAQAVPSLEQAVEQANQYRSRQVQSWFKTYLSETYLADGQIDRAHDLAHQGLKLAQDADHPWGTAIAQRALGRIAYTSGNLADAESHLQEALKTFSSIQAQYHLASTHLDLAALAHTQANQNAATTHLSTAYAWFKKLQVPKWAERTEQLAREYGVTLTEVELEEELSEGSP